MAVELTPEQQQAAQAYAQSNPAAGRSLVSSDPEQTLANITQANYDNYLRDIQPTELELIDKAKSDTSLIDQAVADRDASTPLMQGIIDRNASRYGASLTPAQMQQYLKRFVPLACNYWPINTNLLDYLVAVPTHPQDC